MCTFKAARRRRQNSGTDKNAAQAKRKAAGRRRRQGTKPGTVAGKASAYQAAQAKYRFGQIRPKPVN
jgi:hypothetical protein